MTRTVQDLDGTSFEVPATPPIPATPTRCRICRAPATGRTICEDCLYGRRDEDNSPEETEVFDLIAGDDDAR